MISAKMLLPVLYVHVPLHYSYFLSEYMFPEIYFTRSIDNSSLSLSLLKHMPLFKLRGMRFIRYDFYARFPRGALFNM